MIKRNRHYRYGRARSLKRKRSIKLKLGLFLALLATVYTAYALRPLSYATHMSIAPPSSGQASNFNWPSVGQAAVGIEGQGAAAVSPNEHTVSIASITKLVTALAVLDKKPLKAGEQGASVSFGTSDIDIYNRVIAQDGVAIPVRAGQTMTERQALEAMVLRSANNIAITLGNWAFGSEEAYVKYANSMLRRMGFQHTRVAETSGLNPGSVSTPSELMLLGEMAMRSPVLREITAKPETDIAGFGIIKNTNRLPGLSDSVHALKVGLTDEAGSCLLFWVNPDNSGSKTRVYGAVLGQPDFKAVVAYVNTLAEKVIPSNFSQAKVVSGGEKVATYKDKTGLSVSLTAKNDVVVPYWRGKDISLSVQERGLRHELKVKTANSAQSYALALGDRQQSSVAWRLLHPF